LLHQTALLMDSQHFNLDGLIIALVVLHFFNPCSDIPRAVPPFLACGDLSGWDESEQTMMDADKSYPIEQDYVAPIAPPILPPHQAQEMGENACKSTNLLSPMRDLLFGWR
jgi:hypothetical protein